MSERCLTARCVFILAMAGLVAGPPVPIICETTSLLRLVSGRGGFDG